MSKGNANRDAGRGGNYGSRGGSRSRGGGGSAGSCRVATHKSGDRGRISKVEKSPSGDTIIEITKEDGTTHRDYEAYFEKDSGGKSSSKK